MTVGHPPAKPGKTVRASGLTWEFSGSPHGRRHSGRDPGVSFPLTQRPHARACVGSPTQCALPIEEEPDHDVNPTEKGQRDNDHNGLRERRHTPGRHTKDTHDEDEHRPMDSREHCRRGAPVGSGMRPAELGALSAGTRPAPGGTHSGRAGGERGHTRCSATLVPGNAHAVRGELGTVRRDGARRFHPKTGPRLGAAAPGEGRLDDRRVG